MHARHAHVAHVARVALLAPLALAGGLALASAAAAHVFWVQPARFRAAPGDILKIELRVGDAFPGELVPRNDASIEKFVVVGPTPDKEWAAVGRDADPVAAVYRSAEPGTFLIAYRSKPTPVTLEPAKFEAYLKEKGLDRIIARRSELKQSGSPGREVFSRSAKAVMQFGDTPTNGVATKNMGFRVEIVPTTDPSSLKLGATLSVAVRSEGKPFGNALVQCRNAQRAEQALVARTDDQGRVSFKLPVSGIWVVDTVDMFPATAGTDADWESVWASLTFEIADSDAPVPTK